jgi:anti-anti-sigma factor
MTPISFMSVTMSRRGLTAFAQRGPPDVVVCLRGEHDLAAVAELSATMAQAIALGEGDLVVDLSRVEFMSASTVGVLVWARELLRARSRSLVVRSPSTCARRVLELCELADLVEARAVLTPLTDAAGALGTWVTVPATDGLERHVGVSRGAFPATAIAARGDVASEDVRRVDERPTRVA